MAGMMYFYSGKQQLPPEVSGFKTTPERLVALDSLRQRRPMIMAEYRNYKLLIEKCESIRKSERVPLPDNPGLSRMRRRIKQTGISPVEAWGLLFDYAVPGNVREMAKLLDKRCRQYVRENLSQYPSTEDGWNQQLEAYSDPKYHPINFVPKRSAIEILAENRTFVELLRDAMKTLKN